MAKKSTEVKHNSLRHPPASQMELAEWVEFPERNAVFGSLRPSFGGGGPRPVAILNQPRSLGPLSVSLRFSRSNGVDGRRPWPADILPAPAIPFPIESKLRQPACRLLRRSRH